MNSRLARYLAPDWRTLVSGALIVFSFPPWNFYPLIWFALIPWFAALKRTEGDLKRTFIQGIWLSVFMSLGGFYWVAHVLQQFGGLPFWLAFLGLLLFSVLGQPQFPLFAVLWAWVRRSAPARPHPTQRLSMALFLALAYTGIDWTLPKLFVDTFGHSMYLARYLRQAADLGGATLLTFAIFFVNESLYQLVTEVRRRKEPSLLPALQGSLPALVLALLICAGLWNYGRGRYQQLQEAQAHPTSELRTAVIQANIGDFDKIAAERGISGAAEKVMEAYFRLSDEALRHEPRPQVIIWPETAYPSTFRTPSNAEEMDRDRKVENFVRTRKVPILFGGYDHRGGKDYNAFFFLSPEARSGVEGAGDLQIYRKNMLLLFGEYIPGAEQFDFIKKAFPQVGNFGRGDGPSVLTIEGAQSTDPVRAGPAICYEVLFPNYMLEAVRKGSQMILNITNDSWFGESGEPILHLSLTTFRSIETRKPLLRSTNTGISALILPDGEITQPTPIGVSQILYANVPIIAPIPTLMLAWGDWFGPAALSMGSLGIAGFAMGLGRRRRTRARA